MNVKKTGVLCGIIALLVVTIGFFIKCGPTKKQTGYSIHGRIIGVANKKVILSIRFPPPVSFKEVDSVMMEGDEFVLKGSLDEPALAMLTIVYPDGKKKGINNGFWLGNENINLTADPSPGGGVSFENAHVNEVSRKYSFFWVPDTKSRELIKRIENYKNQHQGNIAPELKKALEQDHTAYCQKVKTIIERHPSSFYMLYAINQTRTRLSADEISELIRLLDFDINEYPTGKQLLAYLTLRKKLRIGETIPEITAYDTAGVRVPPDFSNHKITLVDFWASWCVPCVETIPQLKQLYSRYQDNGFEILSISIDEKELLWRNALSKHQMPWRHAVEHQADTNSCRNVFCLDYIPQNILVDNAGKIVAINVWGQELADYVSGACIR